ncbi:MAG: T9SS type A sorting domain-containing protein [Bacteroidetes bacterium]|nr:T9SS type A sorting domain-containing protein [Bacteroidota bacterium]
MKRIPVPAVFIFPFLVFCFQFFILNSSGQSPNTWTQKASFPGVPRVGAVTFTVGNKTYIGTGQDSSSNLLSDFWEYDPSTNAWTPLNNFSGGSRRGATGFTIGAKGYISTGFDGTNDLKDCWEYDPATDSWLQKKNLGIPMSNPRRDAVSFTVNNKGYVVTGYDGSVSYNKECWEFNGDTTWARRADLGSGSALQTARRWATGLTIDTVGFVGLGFNSSQDWRKDFWKYNLAANTWTQVADFGGNARSGASGFSINGKGFVGTGNNTYLTSDFWQYNPGNNTWTAVAAYAAAITNGIGFSVSGNGYTGLGRDSISFRNDLWQYTPDSTIGIHELRDQKISVTVYPNPFHTTAVLQMGVEGNASSQPYRFVLFDANGKMVRDEILRSKIFFLERKNLPPGIYFYSIETWKEKKNVSSGKIVID